MIATNNRSHPTSPKMVHPTSQKRTACSSASLSHFPHFQKANWQVSAWAVTN